MTGVQTCALPISIIEKAVELDAFDKEFYPTYKKVANACERLPFLNAMMSHITYYRGDSDNDLPMRLALVDLFKYHRQRLDWKNYNIKLNEDLPLEQTLTTETVEELINQD